MKIINDIKNYFDDRGIIRGTREIVETTVAVATVATLAYVVGKQIYVAVVTRGATNDSVDAPIDIARKHGSTVEMLRSAKKTHKQIAKETTRIEHAAIDRLGENRGKMFKSLDYDERRAILEGDGVDIQEMERQIQLEEKINEDLKKEAAARERLQNSLFYKIRNLIPMFRDAAGKTTIPAQDMPKPAEYLLYDYINKEARKQALKKLGPAAVETPNRFIVTTDGEFIPDTYKFKQARTKEAMKLAPKKGYLPPIPNRLNVLRSTYGDKIADAYLDMRAQLYRVTSARRDPFEQEVHSDEPLPDRLRKLEETWTRESKKAMEPQEPHMGDVEVSSNGAAYDGTAGESDFEKQLDKTIAMLDRLGGGVNTLGNAGTISVLDGLMEDAAADAELESMEEDAWNERLYNQMVERCGGIHPKDIPFFDNEFYDTDIDSLSSEPHRPLAHIRHVPLTLDQCKFDTSGKDTPSANPKPKRWKFGNEHVLDFDRTSYLPLHERFKTPTWRSKIRKNVLDREIEKAKWREMHPIGSRHSVLEDPSLMERIEDMEIRNSTKRLRDKSQYDILLDQDLARMMEEKLKKDKKSKKGKKKSKSKDAFDAFDFDDKKSKKNKDKKSSKKGKKSNKKKKKGKKGKKRPDFLDDYSPYSGDMDDLCTSILRGIGSDTAKRLAKGFELCKAGKLYSSGH